MVRIGSQVAISSYVIWLLGALIAQFEGFGKPSRMMAMGMLKTDNSQTAKTMSNRRFMRSMTFGSRDTTPLPAATPLLPQSMHKTKTFVLLKMTGRIEWEIMGDISLAYIVGAQDVRPRGAIALHVNLQAL